MKLRVTKAHIAQGRPNDLCACPVALALIDMFGQPDETEAAIKVDWTKPGGQPYTFSITVGPVHFRVPRTVKAFILSFDKGKPVKPFSFPLEVIAR